MNIELLGYEIKDKNILDFILKRDDGYYLGTDVPSLEGPLLAGTMIVHLFHRGASL